MLEPVSHEVIDPAKLGARERAALSATLFPIHQRIFDGLDAQTFHHYVVESPAAASKLLLYRNQSGEIIGYLGVHRFDVRLPQRHVVVFRTEAGLLPEYRQRRNDTSLWWREATNYKIRHPFKHVYFLCVPVNPSYWSIVAASSHSVYPRYDHQLPDDVLALMTQLAQWFDLEAADEHNPLVRNVGWITKATDEERQFWASSDNPHIRFYLANNPTFTAGTGLLTVVPITLRNSLRSIIAARRARR